PEGVPGATGEHPDRAAVGEAHPGRVELAAGRALEHERDPPARIELQQPMLERRRRIRAIERDRAPGEDAPDLQSVRDDQAARPRRAGEAGAERLPVVAREALRLARIQ